MAQLSIEVGGRSHLIGCEDGQEDRVRELARTLDMRMKRIEGEVAGADPMRLLVMAALMAEDEARTALEKNSELERRAAHTLQEAAARVEAAARRMAGEDA